MANRWLFKTEPSAYSFDELQSQRRTRWDGVKNPLALKHLARIERGDPILVYHTGDEKAVVGIARAASDPYPDPRDAKLLVIDVEAVRALGAPVPLAAVKTSPRFAGSDLVRLPRLSVMPVSAAQWREIERLGGAR